MTDASRRHKLERDMCELAIRLREETMGPLPGGGWHAPLYHVTTPERVPLILRDGFKDSAAGKSRLGITTYQFEPGVWLADVPPVTVISMDQFMGHQDESWIEVLATAPFYQFCMKGNEWQDPSWPTRQWLIPALHVNKLVRREVGLVEVLKLRLANKTTDHHRSQTAAVLARSIESETSGDVQARWRAGLEAAVNGSLEERVTARSIAN